MRVAGLSLFAALAGLVVADSSDVLDLTTDSFPGQVDGEDLALVEFFAPWCGHCKNLAPHYEEAATALKPKGIKLAKVDCTENQELCQDFGVNGYPTLKVFRNGSPTDYTGPRKADGIISYMIKQSLPAVSDVTKDGHAEFVQADKLVLIAYGDDSHPVPAAFLAYAEGARESHLSGQYLSADLPSGLPSTVKPGTIVLHRSFDEPIEVFDGEVDAAGLQDFVKSHAVPVFDEISPENFGTYAEQGLPIAYLFVEPEDLTTLEALKTDITPIAKEFKGKVNFVYIDAIKFIDHGKSLNLPGDSWPAFVIQDLAGQSKFPMSGKVTKKAVADFMKDFVAGKIQPSIKSEPSPGTQAKPDTPVFRLVADEWNKLFDDETKDVFAEFYAPWCGHCQRLAPIYESLGEDYKNDDGIIIAQMDATANDVPPQAPFKVQGFPTLKFRAAGQAEFEDYNGDRSLESLKEFIEQNRTTKSKLAAAAGVQVEEGEEEEGAPEHDEL